MIAVDIRELFSNSYRKYRGLNLNRFWRDVVPDADIVHLSEEDLLTIPEDVTSSVGSYWARRSIEATPSVNGKISSSRTRPPDVMPDSEDSSASNKVHLVVRPLGGERPIRSVTLNSTRDELESNMIEDESQCSIIYENGTGPLSASGSDVVSATSPSGVERAPSCEPNFRNFLAKSVSGLKELNVEQDSETRNPADTGYVHKVQTPTVSPVLDRFAVDPFHPVQSNGEVSITEDALESSQEAESRTKTNLACDDIALDTPAPAPTVNPNHVLEMEYETAPPMETTVERKVVAPKNKLPIAILKPENPRAIRYWLDQRRAARCGIEHQVVKNNEPVHCNEPEECDLFQNGRDQGVHDALGQRVLQVKILYRFGFK